MNYHESIAEDDSVAAAVAVVDVDVAGIVDAVVVVVAAVVVAAAVVEVENDLTASLATDYYDEDYRG